jgi:hypothetical protein
MVQTALLYLAPNDLYKTEKPYTASFEVGNIPGAKKSNIITETREVEIAPVQDRSRFQLDVNGFCVLKEKTSLTMEDALAKTDEVELRYQAELEAILHRHFPEYTRFEAVDFVVRRSPSAVLLMRSNRLISSWGYRSDNAMNAFRPSSRGW